MILPDLNTYLLNFKEQGITYPLPLAPQSKKGLLSRLPIPSGNKTGWPWTEETAPSLYANKTDWPKISIVTPSYNQEKFIEQTIRSVLLQNYPNLEYIIIDGGSTDGTVSIIEKYAPWISYWQSEKDGGQGQAINMGFSLASGDYYAWINSDDYYLKGVFNIVINQFLKTKCDFIYGYGYGYDINTQRLDLIKMLPFIDLFIKIPSLLQPSTFWHEDIHKPIWEELHCSLDFELWMRLVKGNKRTCIKQPLSVANIHGDAKTSDPKMKVKWDEDEKKIWSEDGHGAVPHWSKINFLNKIRFKLYRLLKLF